MEKLILLMMSAVLALSFAGSASAATKVKSYTKKSGTHVQSHNRSNKDKSFKNNWSTKGNTNPYTGKKGTKTHK
ncbi:hypothetical protein ACJ7K1_29455 [Paenibacillus elgii]